MSRASNDVLDLLHGLVAGVLTDELRAAIEKSRDPEDPVPVPPQLIDKALKFLKDNNITAPASNRPMDDLAGQLQDLDLDDEAVAIRH